MKIEYLAEFVDLARTLSYTETAENLMLSESALSRHIKAIEDELGVSLFERTTRRVRLSEQGTLLLPHATGVADAWNTYRTKLRAAKQSAVSTVTLASNYFVSDLVAQFCQENPSISVRQFNQSDSSAQLFRLVERSEYQFAVTIDPPDPADGLESIVIANDSFVAVLPADHKLARRSAIDPRWLADSHFISFNLGSDGDRRVRDICRSAGFEPNIIFTADPGSAIAQFVRDGLGVTFLQRNTLAKMETRGVASVELSPPVQFRVFLSWMRGEAMTPAAQAFLAYCRARAAQPAEAAQAGLS